MKNITKLSLALSALVFAPLCASSAPLKEASQAAAVAPKGKVVKRGKALTQGPVKSLDEVAKTPAAFAGKSVLVSGTIMAVCQAKGCWMTLAGEAPTARARVTFKDYAFFVPKDGKGMKAVLEAEVKVKTLGEAERKHLAEDGKVSVDQIPKVELRLVASGVEISAQ